jgi:hypothetical protein
MSICGHEINYVKESPDNPIGSHQEASFACQQIPSA